MVKKGKSSRDKKKCEIEKEETEECVPEQISIHIDLDPVPVTFPEDVTNHLDEVLRIQISRFLLIKNSFAEIKDVLVDDDHYFLRIIEDFVPFFIKKKKLDMECPPTPKLRQYTRQMILQQATERFQLAPSVINTLQGDYVSQQLNKFFQSQRTVQLPSLQVNPQIFAKNPSLRKPTAKYLLENTFTRNRHEIDEMRPELADNLTTKRKDIFKKLFPLEQDNEILSTLLRDWETEGEIQIPSKNEESDEEISISLRSATVDKEAVRNEAESFRAILGCNKLDDLCSRLIKLQSLEGKRSEDVPEVQDAKLAPIQDLVRRFRLFSTSLEEFLFCEDPSQPKLVPACSLAVRLFSKHQMQVLYDTNKLEIERITKENPPTKESDIASIEKDQKFIKAVLHRWEKRTKLCKRNCVWYLSLPSRTIPRANVTEEEIALLRCKLGDLYLYVYENENDFQQHVAEELTKVRQLIQLGLSLDVWSSFRERKQLDELISYSDKLAEIPIDQFPALASLRKFKKGLEKVNTLSQRIRELETEETEIPALDIRVTKVNKDFVDNLLSTYEEQIVAVKQESSKKSKKKSKKKKEETLSPDEMEAQLQAIKKVKKDMKLSQWTKKHKQTTLRTLPRTASIANLSREERRALSSVAKSKSSANLKKAQTLQQKVKLAVKPLQEAYDELLRNTEEKIMILRNLEQNPNLKPPQLMMFGSSLPHLSLELISASKAVPENISFILETWKILGKYIPTSDIEPYIEKQLANFPAELEQLQKEFGDGEKSVSHTDTTEDPNNTTISRSEAAKKSKGKSNALSELERNGLLILTRGFEYTQGNPNPCTISSYLSAQEQTTLLDYLQYMQGNSQFNQRLAEMLEQESIPFGISSDALKYSRTFTFKSRHLDSLHPLTSKLDAAWTKASSGNDIPKREKVTLKELGILRTMEKWGKDLVRISRLLKAGNEHPMYTVISDAVRAHETLRDIYSTIQDKINSDATYQSGDLLLTVWTRKVKTMQGNRPPTAFSFLMSFTKYEHTAVIYRNINGEVGPVGEPRLSHMYRQYHDSELTLEDLASSDIFRMWAPALVKDKAIRQQLQELLGDDWENIIQERYCVIESTLHSSKQGTLGNIKNPLSRVMNIGAAAVMPWTRIRRTNMDFEKIRSTLYEEDAKDQDLQMTCSEFAAKSQIAALLELDEQLAQELKMDESQKHIFHLPFHAKEKFKTMQPDRLRHLLADNKALRKVPYPDFIERLVYL